MFSIKRLARHCATRGFFNKRTWVSFFDDTDLHEDIMKIVCYVQDNKTMSDSELLERVFTDLRAAVYADGCFIHNVEVWHGVERGARNGVVHHRLVRILGSSVSC